MASQTLQKTENKKINWSSYLRPKVGDTFVHKGFFWTSLNGINTEPGTDNNWQKGNQDVDYPTVIFIGGKDYFYKPIRGNNGKQFVEGDLALSGWVEQNKFAKIMSYKGEGDPKENSSWEPQESIP